MNTLFITKLVRRLQTTIVLALGILPLAAIHAQTGMEDQMLTVGPLTNTFSASPLPDPSSWPGVPIDWCSTARQFPQWISNNLSGEVTTQIRHIVHVGSGLNYLDSNGSWRESEDLIELTPDGGAASLRAPTKTYFGSTPSATPEGGLKIVTKSNLVFTTTPIGVYYFDPSTGKELLLAVGYS